MNKKISRIKTKRETCSTKLFTKYQLIGNDMVSIQNSPTHKNNESRK